LARSRHSARSAVLRSALQRVRRQGQVFGDEVLATAILDRLLHHCDVVAINGPSYRLKNRLTAIENVA
jgi:DNA replication protein DnaC